MKKIHFGKIKNHFSEFNINELALQHKFVMRSSTIISPEVFLLSFFRMMFCKCYSLRQWSIIMSEILGRNISFQAIAKKTGIRHLAFIKALIIKVISKKVMSNSIMKELHKNSPFSRIIIQDSTCVKLPFALNESFPGSKTKYESYSVTRIQLSMELLSGKFLDIGMQAFKDHDCKSSFKLLDYIQPKDLILRDLGYSVYDVFAKIVQKGAYFISRHRITSVIYSPKDQSVMDLMKILKSCDKRKQKVLNLKILIGKKKLPLRLVAMKLPENKIKKRRHNVLKNGNRNKNLSKRTKYLYTWNILITNIEDSKVEAKNIYQYYSLRWHIELIFKTWKSHLRIDKIFTSCQGPNRAKPEMLLYLCLLFIVIIVNPMFNQYQRLVYQTSKRLLSPCKFIKTLINNFSFITSEPCNSILEKLIRNCCYDIRKDRVNMYEKLISINLG